MHDHGSHKSGSGLLNAWPTTRHPFHFAVKKSHGWPHQPFSRATLLVLIDGNLSKGCLCTYITVIFTSRPTDILLKNFQDTKPIDVPFLIQEST
jgi:hypothetical protein